MNRRSLAIAAVVLAAVLLAIVARAPLLGASQDDIRFEAASVKPAAPGIEGEYSLRSDPGMIDWKNVSLLELLKRAYGLPDYQIKGPGWIDQQHYDIVAKLLPPNTPERLKTMLQKLLSDRFRLRLHYETQMIQGYRITVAAGGPKMKESRAPAAAVKEPAKEQKKSEEPRKLPVLTTDRDGWPVPQGMNAVTGQKRLSVKAQSMQYLVNLVAIDTGLPVLDATNLKGYYDIDLQYVSRKRAYIAPEMLAQHPDLAKYIGEVEGETIQSAFKRQLGLNLKAEKVPFQVLVVDHADKAPIPN